MDKTDEGGEGKRQLRYVILWFRSSDNLIIMFGLRMHSTAVQKRNAKKATS